MRQSSFTKSCVSMDRDCNQVDEEVDDDDDYDEGVWHVNRIVGKFKCQGG